MSKLFLEIDPPLVGLVCRIGASRLPGGDWSTRRTRLSCS